MKKIFTLIAAALMTIGANAQTKTVHWEFDGSAVEDGGGKVLAELPEIKLTAQMGEGATDLKWTIDATAATATDLGGNEISYTHWIAANNANGRTNVLSNPNCAYFQFEPKNSGTIQVMAQNASPTKEVVAGVIENDKFTAIPTKVYPGGVATELGAAAKMETIEVSENYTGYVDFAVEAGKTYIYCLNGSKGRIMGFSYTYNDGGASGSDIQIYSEVEPNTYAVTTTLDDVKAAFGEEKVNEAWGMGVWLPADYTLIDNDNMTMKTAVDQTPIYFSGNKFGDMQKEFPAYTGYMNLGSALAQNNWKGDEPANYEEVTALKSNYHGIFAITPKVDGTLSFGVYAGDNSRSIGIIDWATEEEILNEQPSKFVAYNNFRHDGGETETEGVENGDKNSPAYVSGEVKAGRTYLIVGGSNKNLTMHQIKFVPAGGTGINNITTSKVQDNAIYTLQGVRVAKATKGIYIINGKKVVVK